MATTAPTYDTLDDQDLVGTDKAPEGDNDDDDSNSLSALTPKQHQIIALLIQGQSVSAAARALGLHRTTIHHWRRTEPTFALALRDAEHDTSQHWRCATQARAEKALTALDSLLDNERTPATVRLKAVLHVLNTATALPPAAVDPFEQDLLAREQQQRKREQGRVIDQILDKAEALQKMSDDEYRAMLYEGETDEERIERLTRFQRALDLPTSEDEEEEEEVDDNYYQDESPTAALVTPSRQGIHHNSSLFAKSESVESLETPKTVVYATPKSGRNQRCPCQSGRKYKHCCLDKDNQRQNQNQQARPGPLDETGSAPKPVSSRPA